MNFSFHVDSVLFLFVQEEVYRDTTKGLIEGLISGYNATVFAYGPTGCYYTHTHPHTHESRHVSAD